MTTEQPTTPLFEGWGDWVDPRSYLNDASGFGYPGIDGRVSVASDRASGDNPPFWQSEQEHAEIRGICRFLAQVDEIGVASLQTLSNYVVGWGAEENWQARSAESREIAAAARGVWEQVCDAEGLSGMWERESFTRLRRDGERCVWVHADGGEIHVDFIEPEFITEPGSPRQIEDFYDLDVYDWRYGVATTLDRPHRWHGLYAAFFGSSTDWEWLPKRDVVWTRINVDSTIKRGVGDFYPTFRRMEQASKLMTNTMQGAAIQAAIAYIREHAPGTTASGIAAVRGNDDTRTIPTPNGGRDIRVKKIVPGQIVDVSSGLKYTAGPVGAGQGANFLTLVQAAMRLVGIRWSMPEYLISGDASNGNYASTLVAEAPFTKSAEAMQSLEAQARRELIWKVLDCACRLGRFRRYGIETVDELRAVVEVDVTYPPVAVRNRIEDAQVAEIEKRNGVLSSRTWAEDAGRNYEEELRRGAREAVPSFGASPEIVDKPGEPLPSTPDGEIIKPQDTALNGAQVQAAVSIVQSVAAGLLPRDAGLGQLKIMFNLSDQEADQIMGSVGQGFEPKPTETMVQEALAKCWRKYP